MFENSSGGCFPFARIVLIALFFSSLVLIPVAANEPVPEEVAVINWDQPHRGFSVNAGKFQLETGTIALDSDWKKIEFARDFTYPIIVFGPLSYAGYDPATVEIQNVTPVSFEVRIREWKYLDDYHTTEKLSYLAVERGRYLLPSGFEIEADVISTSATGATKPETHDKAQRINFFSKFRENPIVFASKASSHGSDPVTVRVSGITTGKFNLLMQEEENSNQEHYYESIAYIAITPGKGELGGKVFSSGIAEAHSEPSTVDLPFGRQFRIHVDEEESGDEEVDHLVESVGYLVFEDTASFFLANMQTMNGFDPANLRYEIITGEGPSVSAHYVCETDVLEGKCGPYVGSHTYEFSSLYVEEVKALVDTGRGFGCRSTVTFSALTGGSWKVLKKIQANSSSNGNEFPSTEYGVPVNQAIEGFKISDGCACCIDKSEIWLNSVRQQDPVQSEINSDSHDTVTLKHWGGEGSYEEGYDFSAKEVQRYGEGGPDKPNLNPDFYYTGSWERSFPTRQAHNALSPLERIDYGKVGLDQIENLPPRNDQRLEKGHLEAGHTYGLYTKEGNFVLLKVKGEEDVPHEDWHIGELRFSWKLLTRKSVDNSDGCPIFIGGKWVEESGKCSGTLWDIITEGESPELSARVRCDNGYRGTWQSQNVSLSGCTLEFDLTQECTVCSDLYDNRDEPLAINYLSDDSAELILNDGTVIYLVRPR